MSLVHSSRNAGKMAKYRVFFNGRFLTQPLTGVQRYACELIHALDEGIVEGNFEGKNGIDFQILVPRGTRSSIDLKHFPIREVGWRRGHFWEQVELPFYTGDHLLVSLCNTGPIIKKNQVLTIHDAATLDHPEWFRPAFAKWYRFLLRQLTPSVRRVITVSEFSKKRLCKRTRVKDRKVVVCHNGIGAQFRPTSMSQQSKVALEYQLPERFVLSVGSLEPRKNLQNLFAAWAKLRKLVPDVELVIAGGVGKVFSSASVPSAPPKVQFLGYVRDEDLPSLYGAAELFVFPSLYEGFGFPPLEAMACGCPVVVSNTTSLPEVCGNAASYFDPSDCEDIAQTILEALLDDELKQKHRKDGLRHITRFTWRRSAEELMNIIANTAMRDQSIDGNFE